MSVPFVSSPLLSSVEGVVHGFTNRHGGVSAPPHDTLNLGLRNGDDRASVQTNRRAVAAALGKADSKLITLRQIHGDDIVEVGHIAGSGIEADGLWTRDPKAVIAVLVADCVPILFAHAEGRAVGAVHAGWRGTKAKIGAHMVRRFEKAGFTAADLRVAIGPAIGPCCFEVGGDVFEELFAVFPDIAGAFHPSMDGGHVDLWTLNQQMLQDAGISRDHIEVIDRCTLCSDGFFSHRRDKGDTGRQAGVIALG